MSTEKKDTTSSVDDAAGSPDPIASEKGDNAKTVEVSETDLADLTGLLQSYRTVIIAHEERLLEHEGRISTLEQKKAVKLEIPRGRSR
jgi:hypothetical protein